ncbi:hypothetical protein PDE_09600 [Penicillium oxalicum 114-2]|uniref:Uncharacterized protein n=1 Tax=Penicillium oxalicum (strain 114-2 / CGMCC 5302) TaxID=933388 RepID=S8A0I8_PENO1|nr:hypothetical protein PDE_09600 [Penicillium oxalicum 114-2]
MPLQSPSVLTTSLIGSQVDGEKDKEPGRDRTQPDGDYRRHFSDYLGYTEDHSISMPRLSKVEVEPLSLKEQRMSTAQSTFISEVYCPGRPFTGGLPGNSTDRLSAGGRSNPHKASWTRGREGEEACIGPFFVSRLLSVLRRSSDSVLGSGGDHTRLPSCALRSKK